MTKIESRIFIISAIFLTFALCIGFPLVYNFFAISNFSGVYGFLLCLAIKTSIVTTAMLHAVIIFGVNQSKFVYALAVSLMITAYLFTGYLIILDVATRT
jgi:hypothetical protein